MKDGAGALMRQAGQGKWQSNGSRGPPTRWCGALAVGGLPVQFESSRKIQVLARIHWRFTVESETFKTCAVSFNREAAEKAQFHDPVQFRIVPAKFRQRVIQSHQIQVLAPGDTCRLIQRQPPVAAAAFGSPMRARVVHQDIADQCRRDSVKMRAIPPLDAVLIGQAQVGFVQYFGGLEGVAATLAPQISIGETMQFPIHERDHPIEGLCVPIPPAHEQFGDPAKAGGGVDARGVGQGIWPLGDGFDLAVLTR